MDDFVIATPVNVHLAKIASRPSATGAPCRF
jgi:hypothetical protein